MSEARVVDVIRVAAGGTVRTSDAAAVEEPLEIRLHDRAFAVIMRTPGSDRQLASGFLLAEGIISNSDDLGAVEHCRHPDHAEAHNVVNVFLLGDAAARLESVLAERRNVLSNSSCGICGRVTIDSLKTRALPLATASGIEAEVLHDLPAALRSRQVGAQSGDTATKGEATKMAPKKKAKKTAKKSSAKGGAKGDAKAGAATTGDDAAKQ